MVSFEEYVGMRRIVYVSYVDPNKARRLNGNWCNIFRDTVAVNFFDKVEKIEFVGGEWHVVLKDGVVHHYPSVSYVFELIDSLNYYNNKTFTVFFVDGSSKTFPNTHDVQITHSKGVEDTMTIVWDEREDCRTVTQFPMHEITTYSGEEK